MKFLVLLVVVFIVLWAARSLQQRLTRAAPRAQSPPAVGHEDLPACAHCGVYLPRSEALAGPDGVFCSEAHRSAFRAGRTDA